MISSSQIQEQIRTALTQLESVEAAWLGGSAAFNRTDEYSDFDIRVLAAKEYSNEIYEKVENALRKLSPIAKQHIVTKHSLAGCYQRFYWLENTSPYLVIDFVIVQENVLYPFLEQNRHGIPVILFDKNNKIKPHHSNADLLANFSARIPEIISEFKVLSSILVERAVIRNRFAEAVHFYHTRVLSLLLELLRARHCPIRQDFGVRYIHWDLPKEICEQVDVLYAVSNFEDLKTRLTQAQKLFWQTADEINKY